MVESEHLDPGLRAAFGPASVAHPASVVARLGRGGTPFPPVLLRDEPAEADAPLQLLASATWERVEGRYEVLGEIAHGGMGVILKGHDIDLGRDVAIKVLREEHLARPDVLQRFVEEAQIGGQLQHPGIVPVYELGLRDDRRPFFTMKLVNGTTLAALLSRRESPAFERWRYVAIFGAVCQTMAYAHARGVVHRDLKPANVMVGPFGEVLVVDWGMGKVLRHDGAGDELRAPPDGSRVETVRSGADGTPSVAGSLMGTPAYMPPEQARGDVASVDERSDVFALGAMLCEILTGSPPYVGDAHTLVERATRADPGAVAERLQACGAEAELIRIALACLAPAPMARPADASVLAAQVATHLASVDERAHRARIDSAAAKARTRSLIVGGTALCAALALGVVGTSWQALRATQAEGFARGEADRAGRLLKYLANITSATRRFGRDLTMSEMLDNVARRAESDFEGQPQFESDVRFTLGNNYFFLGQPAIGESNLRRAHDLRAGLLGPDDPATLECDYTLARHLVFQGRIREAEQLATGAIDTLRARRTREDDEHLLAAQGVLTFVHDMRGDFAENEALCRSIMANSSGVTGKPIDESFHLMRALVGQGKYVEAESLASDRLQSGAIQADGSGEQVDWQAAVILARCARGRGEADLADQIVLEAWARIRSLQGDEDAGATFLLEELGWQQTLRHRYADAEKTYRMALEQSPRLFGESFGGFDDRRQLAWALLRQAMQDQLPDGKRQDMLAEAEGIYQYLVGLCSRTPCPDPEILYGTLNQYAWFLCECRRPAEAEPIARVAVDGYRGLQATRDGDKVAAFDTLAVLLRDRGALAEAEELFRECLSLAAQAPPDNTTLVPEVQLHLGEMLILAGRSREAEDVLRESFDALTRIAPRGMPLRRSVIERLAEVYEARNETQRAAEFRDLLKEPR